MAVRGLDGRHGVAHQLGDTVDRLARFEEVRREGVTRLVRMEVREASVGERVARPRCGRCRFVEVRRTHS